MTTVADIRAALEACEGAALSSRWGGLTVRIHALLASLPADGVIVTAEQAAFAEAWERAEKACPEGWHLNQVCAPLRSAPSQWAVIAAPDDWTGPDSVFAYGPTPTAALTALAEKLESANSES